MAENAGDETVAKAVFEAAKAGNEQKLRSLLKDRFPAPVHYQEVGYTALHNAAGKGHALCVEALLAAGAPLHVKASGGYTCLHDAARNGHAACIRLLLAAGANINEKNNFGGTPLHGAAFYGKVECVSVLLEAGTDWHAKTNDGKTALALTTNDEVKALLTDASMADAVKSVTIALSPAELRGEMEKLQVSLRSSRVQIDTLEGQLMVQRKKAEELEVELREHKDRGRKERELAELLEGAGWRHATY